MLVMKDLRRRALGRVLGISCSVTLVALFALWGCEESAPPDAGTSSDGAITPDAAPPDAAPSDGGDAGPPVDPAVDALIRDAMTRSRLPGLSAAIVVRGEVVWTGVWGLADVRADVPVRPDTIFMLASISKAVTALAVMHAVEAGVVDLDADVQTYLPFVVTHPTSSAPITLRGLLTHTAGIADDNEFIWSQYTYGADASEALGAYLERYLAPTGADYAESHFGAAPGTAWDYSNIGLALAGYVIEAATGTDFAQYCETHLFSPMGLVDTHWHLRDTDNARVALPHEWDDGYTSPGHYGYADYPNGQLRSTAAELAQFLRLVLADGVLDGRRLLTAETIAELQRRQVPSIASGQAMGWRYYDGPPDYFGHGGDDRGAAAEFSYRVQGEIGLVVLTNGSRRDRSAFNDIELALFEFAEGL